MLQKVQKLIDSIFSFSIVILFKSVCVQFLFV